jgi:hypothetical protein
MPKRGVFLECIFWATFISCSLFGIVASVEGDRHFHKGYSDGTTFVLSSGLSLLLAIVLLAIRLRSGYISPLATAVVAGVAPGGLFLFLEFVFALWY